MFVRRLLVSAVLASLAACAAPTSTFVVDKNPNLKQRTTIGSVDALDYQLMPKRESAAFSATVSTQNANSTALCLQQHLSSEFKLPPEFISHKVYTDNNHSVGLINPFTKVEGITMDVVNKGSSSEIKLYDNGNLLSRAWKQLPSKCGQGKTTTLAQDTGSKTKTTTPAQSGVDFIAASKAENKPAVALAASTPAVIKAVPAIKATPARIIQDSTPAIPLQAAKAVSASPSSAFNTSNTAPVLATAAKESSINTPIARSSFTQETPAPTNFVARTDAASPTEPARWDHGDLTQDDMSIIAPATAAVVTPAMAIAAKSMASNDGNNVNTVKASSSRATTSSKPTTTSKAVESNKPKASSKKPAENQEKATNNRGKTTANASNSKQTAKDKANNSRNKADDNKANSKNSRTKATEKADKAENTKNSRTKNSKAAAAEEKNSSKAKNSRNKAQDKDDNKTSKGKKTNERNVKADKNDDNNKTNNKKASAKNNDSGKNNKKTTQERDNNSKAKASGNKSKATDKKAESAKKPPKKDKAK